MNPLKKLYAAWKDKRLIFETERVIQNGFRMAGLNVTRYVHGDPAKEPLAKMLEHQKITLVLDVGANIGQYARNLFRSGYKGRLVSFEPIPYAYQKLKEAAKDNPLWKVAENCAIGEKDGETTINISKNSVSSSLLPQTGVQEKVEPGAAYTRDMKVKMHKLDTVAAKYIRNDDRIFLKLDVQGYEDYVLKGANETLPKAAGIQLETSLVPLYRGEVVFEEMLKKIESKGFKLYDLVPGFRNNTTGRLLQVDCIFFRE